MLNSEAMREIRNERQMSRRELAELLNVHKLTVRRWETEKQNPGPHTMQALADALGCKVEDLTREVAK